MNYTDLVNEVYTLTNRPDLVNETATAIKSATLKAHHLDFFPKDLYENYFAFEQLHYYQQLSLSSIPNYRALKYLRKYYPGTNGNNPPIQDQQPLPPLYAYYSPGPNLPDGRFFTIIGPEEVLDSYGINRVDVAYLAGQTIQIRSGDKFQNMLIGAYVHPNITPGNFTSWIANENPYAIIFSAASIVFKTIGYDEQYSAYDELKNMEYQELQQSNILAVGS